MKCSPCDSGDEPRLQTPEPVFNLPGQQLLDYRVGQYASFRESMIRRLSTMEVSPTEPRATETAPEFQLNEQFILLLLDLARDRRAFRKLVKWILGKSWEQISTADIPALIEELRKALSSRRLCCDPLLDPAVLRDTMLQELAAGQQGDVLLENIRILQALAPDRLASEQNPNRPLARLTTRMNSDPTMAFLDAWANVADVLTFYQERIANEAYLRTAKERKSLIELAYLVGYRPRPGLAASGYVAFTLDDGLKMDIPAGTPCQSIPAPGTSTPPQTFETAETIHARAVWNELRPRLTRPQKISRTTIMDLDRVYLQGVHGNLRPNQYLLFVFGTTAFVRHIAAVEADGTRQRTVVTMREDLLSPVVFFHEIVRAVDGLRTALPVVPPAVKALKDELEAIITAATPAPDSGPTLVALDKIVEDKLCQPLVPDKLRPVSDVLKKLLPSGNNEGMLQGTARLFRSIGSELPDLTRQAQLLGRLEYFQSTTHRRLLDRLETCVSEVTSANTLAKISDALRKLYLEDFTFDGDIDDILKESVGAILKNAVEVPTGSGAGPLALARARLIGLTPTAAVPGPPPVSATPGTPGILPFAVALIKGRTLPPADTYQSVVSGLTETTLSDVVTKLNAIQTAFAADNGKGLSELKIEIKNAISEYVAKVNTSDVTALQDLGDPSIAKGIIELLLVKLALQELGADKTADLKGLETIAGKVKDLRDALDATTAVGTVFQGVKPPSQDLADAMDVVRNNLHQAIFTGPTKTLIKQAEVIDGAQSNFQPLASAFFGLETVVRALDVQAVRRREEGAKRVATRAGRYARVEAFPEPHDATVQAAVAVLTDLSKWNYPGAPAFASPTRPILEQYANDLEQQTLKLEGLKATAAAAGRHDLSERLAQAIEDLLDVHERLVKPGGSTETTGTEPDIRKADLNDLLQLFEKLQGRSAGSATQASLKELLSINSDVLARLAHELEPQLRERLFSVWRRLRMGEQTVEVYAMRDQVGLFGRTAPQLIQLFGQNGVPLVPPIVATGDWEVDASEKATTLFLDSEYLQPRTGGFIAVHTPGAVEIKPYRIARATVHPRSAYSVSCKTTEIALDNTNWWTPFVDAMRFIRETSVLLQGEALPLAEEPILEDLGIQYPAGTIADDLPEAAAGQVLLNGLFEGLSPGQRLILEGEMSAAEQNVSGIRETIPVELSHVIHHPGNAGRPGDSTNTLLVLTQPLPAKLKRDTVRILANVARVTHGLTVRDEVLGSGDGSQPSQRFKFSRQPLTYVSAPTRNGAQSTLELRVNGVRWHEADALLDLHPSDRKFVTSRDENETVTIETGDGVFGARLPAGVENVRATYRVGLGEPGNVPAGSITMPPGEPFGIRAVNNMLPTSGGAEPEGNEQIRELAPLGVMSFDRLVSVRDYADFARTFAGIGKANASKIQTRHRAAVLVTIDGTGLTPIQPGSDVVRNLKTAYRRLGDPDLPVLIRPAERLVLFLQGKLGIDPDYTFKSVRQAAEAALLSAFRFERRQLGQDVYRSEVVSVLQSVPGVEFVDIDVFKAVPQRLTLAELNSLKDQLSSAASESRILVNHAGIRRYRTAKANPEGTTPKESGTVIASNFLTNLIELQRLNPQIPLNLWDSLLHDTELIVSLTWPAQIAYFGVPELIVLSPAKGISP